MLPRPVPAQPLLAQITYLVAGPYHASPGLSLSGLEESQIMILSIMPWIAGEVALHRQFDEGQAPSIGESAGLLEVNINLPGRQPMVRIST
jgi:hypothetical protein